MPTQIPGMPEAAGLGISGQMAQNLNPAYANQLFTNIQQAQAGLRKRNTQNAMDQAGRFGATGGNGIAQGMQQQGDQAISGQTMQAAGDTAAKGAEMGQQNNQFNAQLAFQGSQNAAQRALMQQQMENQMNMFNTERGDSRVNDMMNLFGGLGIGALKYGLGNQP